MPEVLLLGVFGFGSLAGLTFRRQSLFGTTLRAPWYWSVVAVLSVTAVELLLSTTAYRIQGNWMGPLRYLAATATLTSKKRSSPMQPNLARQISGTGNQSSILKTRAVAEKRERGNAQNLTEMASNHKDIAITGRFLPTTQAGVEKTRPENFPFPGK